MGLYLKLRPPFPNESRIGKAFVEVTETHALGAFDALRDEWDTLLSGCSTATIFQTWEWNDSWWRTLGSDKKLLILQARERGRLVGLAPLLKTRLLGVQRAIQFIGNGTTDYMDVGVADERKHEICDALLNHLLRTQDFDLIDLGELQRSSPLCAEAPRFAGLSRDVTTFRKGAREFCFGMNLPPSWEEFGSQIGRKMTRTLSYKKRLLERSFDQVEIRLTNPAELQEVLTALFDLHQKRWRLRGERGVLGNRKVQEFYRLVTERFTGRGWTRLHFIKLNGRYAGVACCFQFRGRYYGYLSGFDPELSRYGLGSLLIEEEVRQAIKEGCTYFDMLRGEESYKRQWGCESSLNQNLLFVSSGGLRPGLISGIRLLEQNLVATKARLRKAVKKARGFAYDKLERQSLDAG